MLLADASLLDQLSVSGQLALAVILLAAAAPKLAKPKKFSRTVAAYKLIPRSLAPLAAVGVALAELTIACWLVIGYYSAVAALAAAALFAIFASAVGMNLVRGRRISCGCFGGESEPISGRSLLRLGLLVAGSALLVAAAPSESSLDVLRNSDSPAYATVAIFGIALFWLVGSAWVLRAADVRRVVRLRRVMEGP